MTAYGSFPARRLRRMRAGGWIRDIVRETRLCPEDFILPVFVTDEPDITPIPGFIDVCRYPLSALAELADRVAASGVRAVMLFPYIAPDLKDDSGSEAFRENNLICRSIKAFKQSAPHIGIICDIALDPYTTHGHDGIVKNGIIQNDETAEILGRLSVCLAEAGADMVAPSDMMDGRVKCIREALDSKGLQDTSILSYAVKYASACYGPFRNAVGSRGCLQGADKKTYQMDVGNAREAYSEAALDINEGADILMVKPSVPYLDIIQGLRERFSHPIFAYHVSGEYVMIHAAAEKTDTDPMLLMTEYMTSCKRAGADAIVTYAAIEMAELCAL